MSEKTQTAAFTFTNYIVKKVSFTAPEIDTDNLIVDFEPSGLYNTESGIYKLVIGFIAKYGEKEDKVFAEVIVEGSYKFKEGTQLNDFPEYFYPNSIAIIYPYLRAFITTITSVGNIKPLILPTLNLSSLAEPLRENTEVI